MDRKALLIGIFALCLGSHISAAIADPPQVLTSTAHLSTEFDTYTYLARVESKINAKLISETDGVVSQILTPLGSKVGTHTQVMVIQHTDPVYQYAPLSVVSPVKGIVSQVQVTEGSSVTRGQVLATVTDPSQIRVLIEVSASDLQKIKPQMKGDLVISGRSSSEKAKVEVKGVSPLVDPTTGTATCELAINKDKISSLNLPPGSVGQVTFKTNERKAFLVPENAVVYKGTQALVRIIENGKIKKMTVSLGLRKHGQIEIIEGLKEGDEIVERSSRFLSDGETVKVEKN